MCYNCIQLKNIIVDEHINYDKFLINFGLEDWKVTLFVNKSEGKKKKKITFYFRNYFKFIKICFTKVYFIINSFRPRNIDRKNGLVAL